MKIFKNIFSEKNVFLLILRKIAIFATLCAVLITGLLLRSTPEDGKIKNIDEIISRDVVGGMLDRKDFNPDWQKVSPSLPHDFGKFRYNFSSYLLVLRFYCSEFKESVDRLAAIRSFNLILFAIGIIGLLACIEALNFSRLSGLIVLFIYSLSPGNIHDAHMARPETFLATLTILYLLMCIYYYKFNIYVFGLVASFVLGFAMAAKFTFVILMALIIFHILSVERGGIVILVARVLGVLLFICFGFSLGAPYALVDFQGYINGVTQLSHQYSNLHLPHSYVSGGSTWLWQFEFFFKIYGLIVILPFISIIFTLATKKLSTEFYFSACALIFIFIFARASVFFERNLNPIIPLFALLVGFYINRMQFKRGIFFGFVIAIPLMYWSYWVYGVQLNKYSLNIDKIEYGLIEKYKPVTIKHQAMIGDFSGCGLIRFVDYSDQTSRESREDLLANDWIIVFQYKGPFHLLPTSTLHTYLSGNIYWYLKNCTNEKK
jgi:hypothetical protein